jgi:hypothetical protein
VEVRLLGAPIDRHRWIAARYDEVRRELTLLELSGGPPALVALGRELRDDYGSFSAQRAAELDAVAAGATTDLTFHVPPAAADRARRLDAILDEILSACERGELLAEVSDPAMAEYRRWFLGQFWRQVEGEAPTPWVEPAGRSAAPAAADGRAGPDPHR